MRLITSLAKSIELVLLPLLQQHAHRFRTFQSSSVGIKFQNSLTFNFALKSKLNCLSTAATAATKATKCTDVKSLPSKCCSCNRCSHIFPIGVSPEFSPVFPQLTITIETEVAKQ